MAKTSRFALKNNLCGSKVERLKAIGCVFFSEAMFSPRMMSAYCLQNRGWLGHRARACSQVRSGETGTDGRMTADISRGVFLVFV